MRPQVKKIILLAIIFSLVGMIILSASFYFLYVEGVQVSQKQLDDLKVVLDEYKDKKNKIPQLEEQLRQMKLRAQKAEQQIPPFDENEFDQFLIQLRTMARATGVQVKPPKTTASQAAKIADPNIVRATYELSAAGDFKKLWDFLKVVESSIRFVDIENYGFTKGKGETNEDQTQLTMRVSVFAFRTVPSVLPPPPVKEQPKPTDEPPQ
jgi:Tfp pilus assembly protein PilO